MRGRRKGHKPIQLYNLILCCIIGISALLGMTSRAYAEEEAEKPLRVVLVNYDAYGYVTLENEEVGGYFVEYLQQIAHYTDWEYEYEVVSDEESLVSIVRQGDYDLMVGVPYDAEDKEQYFEFSSAALADRRLLLAATKTHSELTKDNLRTQKGVRVGYTGNIHNEELMEKFKSYCFSNGITYTMGGGDKQEQNVNLMWIPEDNRFEMLKEGIIDAVFTTDSLALKNNLYVVADFGTMPLYIVAPKGRTEYIEKLNAVQLVIQQQNNYYREWLYNKYFAVNEQRELALSKDELAFLNETKEYTVALTDNCAPYSYINDKGEWSGIAVEVFQEITRMTGGKMIFTFKRYNNSFEAEEAVNSHEADIFGVSNISTKMFDFVNRKSNVYYVDYVKMYSNKSFAAAMDLKNAVFVIMDEGYRGQVKEFAEKNSARVIKVDTISEALAMVNSGEADFTMILQKAADYYISYNQWNKIVTANTTIEPFSFGFVYHDSMDSMAKQIINHCIDYIDEEALNTYIMNCILAEHKSYSFGDYVKTHWESVTVVLLSFFVVVCIFLSFIIVTIHKKSKRIYHMLYYDDVTKGISRLKFEQEVSKLTAEGAEKYYILFADICSFKYINDVFGYKVGNQVLVLVEGFMRRLTEGYPEARMYSDHFVGLRFYEEKEILEDKLRRMLEEFDAECAEKYTEFNIFLKMGIYEWDVKNHSKAEIMQVVNLASYAADSIENLAKSEYRFYTMELHDSILRQQEIEKDMRRAMADGEFQAYYQPKYDIVTDKIIGAEALVRWKHKSKGLLSPGLFVPVFEKNGFIMELDFYVLAQVCELLAERMEKGQKLYPISCNFSRQHFFREDFVEHMTRVVREYEVPPGYIEIEITETIATNDFERLIDTVKALKDRGFKISIDDFGSGYSCIQLLYKLPIDVLKFDRIFVTEQDVNKKEEDINRSIIHICHSNDIKVICEGIETSEQRDFVKSYDCRYVQGYFYSKPVDRECFMEMLKNDGA